MRSEPYPVQMDKAWESEFQERMRSFEAAQPHDGMSVSLKVRVTSGCFHREHSPHAYALIDEQLASVPPDETDFAFVEHESGPELLVILTVVTASLQLAKSVVDLLAGILDARREGVKKGDGLSDAVELIARRVQDGDTLREETVLRIEHSDPIDRERIEALLEPAIERLSNGAADKDQ